MPNIEFGFGPDATVSEGSNWQRINYGRDEVNAQNGNEGGIRFVEDGVELWFTASDSAAINKGINELQTGVYNGVSGSLTAQTSNQSDENFPLGENDPALLVPPGDVYQLKPVDTEGRFRSTDSEPLELTFGIGLGIWTVTAYKEDGTTETISVGHDLREQDTLGDGYEPTGPEDRYWNFLDNWGPETITFPAGVYTRITFESETPQLALNKSPSFQLDTMTTGYYCFLQGTLIETKNGPVPVEDLKPGDMLITADGRKTPVIWVGHQYVPTPVATKECANPIRIAAGAIAENVPKRNLYVSPDHAIFIDGMLYCASALQNGNSINQVDLMPMTGFNYYHVETEAHEVILAEGCPTETYLASRIERSLTTTLTMLRFSERTARSVS